MLSMFEKNSRAIYELSRGNDFLAQSMFRTNVRRKPCCLSWNNIGVFYSQYGMIQKSGKIQSAKKIGRRYLLKAAQSEEDWRNLVSAASALFEVGVFFTAYQLLTKAYRVNSNTLFLYNIGCCLFRLGRYKEAISVFETLCSDDAVDFIVQNSGQHPFLILAYCHHNTNNRNECVRYVQKYSYLQENQERLDVFHLRYLCGLYDEALNQSFDLLKEWYPSSHLLAVLAECVTYVPAYGNSVDSAIPPEKTKFWRELRNDEVLRSQKIQEYIYVPPSIELYYFIE